MNKPRPDSRLFQLSQDQQAQVHEWILTIGFAKTRERLASPEPDGFGLKTHLSSLHRFLIRYSAAHQENTLAEAESAPGSPTPRLLGAAEKAMHSGAFQRSTSPMDTDSFREVSQWINSQRDQELKRDYFSIAEQKVALARERLALDREKFQFNVARQVIIHYATIDKIVTNPTTDDDDKINAVRAAIFNTPVNELPPLQRPNRQDAAPPPLDTQSTQSPDAAGNARAALPKHS